MKTHISPLTPESAAAVLESLLHGGVGLFPTDTVYGIGCRADSSEGTGRIFDIKGREFAKTLPILIGDWSQFEKVAEPLDADFALRLRAVWPGGLTAVVRASKSGVAALASDCLREGTVAVRMPAHGALRKTIRDLGAPLAATSANLSGEKERLRLRDIPLSIRERVDWEWDEDIPNAEIRPSTVVDLTGASPVVLRVGEAAF